jgi:hypothetical protein
MHQYVPWVTGGVHTHPHSYNPTSIIRILCNMVFPNTPWSVPQIPTLDERSLYTFVICITEILWNNGLESKYKNWSNYETNFLIKKKKSFPLQEVLFFLGLQKKNLLSRKQSNCFPGLNCGLVGCYVCPDFLDYYFFCRLIKGSLLLAFVGIMESVALLQQHKTFQEL